MKTDGIRKIVLEFYKLKINAYVIRPLKYKMLQNQIQAY